MGQETEFIGIGDIVFWVLLITISGAVSYVIWRAMERPRLRLIETADGPRAMPRDVIAYALTIPFLIIGWIFFFAIILMLADNKLDAYLIIILPMAIVMATRLLAHIRRPIAHELGKAVPLTLLTLIILSGGVRDEGRLLDILEDLDRLDITGPLTVFVLAFDYVITGAWYWLWIRWGHPRRIRRMSAKLADSNSMATTLEGRGKEDS